MKSYTLRVLADHLNADVQGDDSVDISTVGTLDCAGLGQISFLANSKYRSQLDTTAASAVLMTPSDAEGYKGNAILLKDPYVGFARIAQLLDTTPNAAESIHSSAQIAASAMIGEDVAIGANAVIGENVILGNNVQIGAGAVVGQDSVIGANSLLWANVTVYHNVQLGQDCIIHSGTILGADGFGYANERGQWIKIPQTGGVRIGDRVEIGANTTVDRGAIEHTEIHDGVIVDNQVQIGHNVIIGENTAVAGSTAIAGSVTIGKHCIIGGCCAISGHLSICDGVHLSGSTNVTSNMNKPGLYSSATVAMDNKVWRKNTVRFRQLDGLFQRVKTLEKNVK